MIKIWNYDELFAVGNVLGVRNLQTNKTQIRSIDTEHSVSYWKFNYGNLYLKSDHNQSQIEFIVKLDGLGNVTKHLFDRKDIEAKLNLMPKLVTLMTIRDQSDRLGIVVLGKIIYQNGGWNYVDDFNEYGERKGFERSDGADIVKVYHSGNFECCDDGHLLWEKE